MLFPNYILAFNFLAQNIGAKVKRKMLMKLTLGFCSHRLNSISGQKLLGMGSWFRTLCPSGFRNALLPS